MVNVRGETKIVKTNSLNLRRLQKALYSELTALWEKGTVKHFSS